MNNTQDKQTRVRAIKTNPNMIGNVILTKVFALHLQSFNEKKIPYKEFIVLI